MNSSQFLLRVAFVFLIICTIVHSCWVRDLIRKLKSGGTKDKPPKVDVTGRQSSQTVPRQRVPRQPVEQEIQELRPGKFAVLVDNRISRYRGKRVSQNFQTVLIEKAPTEVNLIFPSIIFPLPLFLCIWWD